MLTAGARPQSRSEFNNKRFAVLAVVYIIVALPLPFTLDWLIDRTNISLFNAATIKAILIFIPIAFILRLIVRKDDSLWRLAGTLAFMAALTGIFDLAHKQQFIDLWPAPLVTLLMFFGFRKWELARRADKQG